MSLLSRNEELLIELKNNQTKNFDELFKACEKEIKKNKYYKMVPSCEDRDDLIQNIMLRIINKKDYFDEKKGNFEQWIAIQTKNAYCELYKKEISRKKQEISIIQKNEEGEELNLMDLENQTRSVEEDYISSTTIDKIYEKVDSLQTNYKEAIVLCRIGGMKPSNAAQILNCKSSDISNWLLRGTNDLRKKIKKDDTLQEFYEAMAV